ncbi:MAG TPA: SRPBCC domain-containing protein [Patescibacteria group bacterium]|jgi:uncharacterized protein YndB with AHSA1/START domain|nr:SRPBCC domain-containing protein [Patescibacteria group bacterium]
MSKQVVTKDVENKTLTIKREFDTSRERLWRAWSDASLLSRWWGPREWPATTKSFDFSPGGHWHYFMTGPDGTQAWGWLGYKTIDAPDNFTAEDSFSNEAGEKNSELPHTHWDISLDGDSPTTLITTLTFTTEADLQKILDMGFEAGYTESLDQLEELSETEK